MNAIEQNHASIRNIVLECLSHGFESFLLNEFFDVVLVFTSDNSITDDELCSDLKQ